MQRSGILEAGEDYRTEARRPRLGRDKNRKMSIWRVLDIGKVGIAQIFHGLQPTTKEVRDPVSRGLQASLAIFMT